MRFEITFLHADGDHVAHTADAAEIGRLVAWAGRTGVRLRIRPGPVAPGGGNGATLLADERHLRALCTRLGEWQLAVSAEKFPCSARPCWPTATHWPDLDGSAAPQRVG